MKNGLSVPLKSTKLHFVVALSRKRPRVRVPSSPPILSRSLSGDSTSACPRIPLHLAVRSQIRIPGRSGSSTESLSILEGLRGSKGSKSICNPAHRIAAIVGVAAASLNWVPSTVLQPFIHVGSKLKCPLFVAGDMSGFIMNQQRSGLWESGNPAGFAGFPSGVGKSAL